MAEPLIEENRKFWPEKVEEEIYIDKTDEFVTDLTNYGAKVADNSENLLKEFMDKAYATDMEAYLADAGMDFYYADYYYI